MEIDMDALIDTLLITQARQRGDELVPAVLPIFKKYGIPSLVGLKMTYEVMGAVEKLNEQRERRERGEK